MNVIVRRRSYRLGIGVCVLIIILFQFLKQKEIVVSSPFQSSPPLTDIEDHIRKPLHFPPPQPKQPDHDATLRQPKIPQDASLSPIDDVDIHPPLLPLEHKPQKPLKYPSNNTVTLAIMTTILNPDPTFPIWLDYHLRRFNLIIIFLDDPSEQPMLEQLVKGKPVVFFNGSTAWSDSVPDRLIIRQEANVNAALAYSLSKNITWLLHIDIDELFYENGNRSWETWDGVGSIQFINHEAVSSPREVVNFFEECNIFRFDGESTGFMAYVWGKSAVRVTAGVYGNGPHKFEGYQGEKVEVRVPMILHYPTPTFDRWVAKYKLYGNFSDIWFGDSNRPMMRFMAQSRDLVHAAVASGNWDKAREYYYSWIPDNATMGKYLRQGDFRLITPLTDMG